MSRGRTVEVRWWLSETKKFRTRSLGFGIRDERGVIDPELEQEAVRQTQSISDSLRSGRGLPLGEEEDSGPVTLEAGFEIATTVPTGMYVVETEHLREVRRAARDIVRQ